MTPGGLAGSGMRDTGDPRARALRRSRVRRLRGPMWLKTGPCSLLRWPDGENLDDALTRTNPVVEKERHLVEQHAPNALQGDVLRSGADERLDAKEIERARQ